MKNVARLILLFIATTLLFSVATAAVISLHRWILAAGTVPTGTQQPLQDLLEAFILSLPFAFYGSVAVALGYTVRRGIPAAAAYLILPLLSAGTLFSLQWSAAALRTPAQSVPPTQGPALLSPGLLIPAGELVFLGGDTASPRFVSAAEDGAGIPVSRADLALAPRPPGILVPILRDFQAEAANQSRFWEQGAVPFVVNIAVQALMLSSFRFVFALTAWPLANTLLGILLFRWVLVFALFLQTDGYASYFSRFLGNVLPGRYYSLAAMAAVSLVMILYTLLSYLAREKKGGHG